MAMENLCFFWGFRGQSGDHRKMDVIGCFYVWFSIARFARLIGRMDPAPIFTHQSLELCARPQGARWQVSIGCAVEPLMVCCLQSPWPRRWAPTCSLHYRHNLLQTEIAQNTSMIQGSFALTQVSFEVQFWERTFTLESYWLPVWDFAKGASTYHQIIRTWTSNLILTKLILGLWLLSRRVISSMTSWSKGILPGNLKQFDFKKIKKLKDTV